MCCIAYYISWCSIFMHFFNKYMGENYTDCLVRAKSGSKYHFLISENSFSLFSITPCNSVARFCSSVICMKFCYLLHSLFNFITAWHLYLLVLSVQSLDQKFHIPEAHNYNIYSSKNLKYHNFIIVLVS